MVFIKNNLSHMLSQYSVALFHLVNHAFFKALLFLSAGAIIHALNDEQRLNKMGGLVRLLPFTYSMSAPREAFNSLRT
jgi:NADH-ubiquinone oxidoreductase chain 5